MADEQSGSSLAIFGKKIRALFQNIEKLEQTSVSGFSLADWKHESNRFYLWADNLGLHHRGHSSLDYRLRDADALEKYIRNLLGDLNKTLLELLNLASDDKEQEEDEEGEEEGDTESEPAEIPKEESDEEEDGVYLDDYEDEAEAVTLRTTVTDILDRLYRVATKIRNPNTRQITSKAANFKQTDENGVDLFECYEKVDRLHLEEVFWEYGTLKTEYTDELSKEELDRKKRPRVISEKASNLLERLAAANTLRRRQFAYWRRHRAKNSFETAMALEKEGDVGAAKKTKGKSGIETDWAANVSEAPQTVLSRPSTATNLQDPSKIKFDDAASTYSTRTIAPRPQGEKDEQVDLPEPPKAPMGQKHFLCPYCFTLCSNSLLKKEAWREHVFRDLRPYVCTYLDCKAGNQLYDSWKDWASHERWAHNKAWSCPEHPEDTFSSLPSFQQHLAERHGQRIHSLEIEHLVSASEVVSPDRNHKCVLCSHTARNFDALQNHMATHLQRIALFTLPRSTELEEDSAHGDDSLRMSHSDDLLSRDEDFQSDISGWDDRDNPAESETRGSENGDADEGDKATALENEYAGMMKRPEVDEKNTETEPAQKPLESMTEEKSKELGEVAAVAQEKFKNGEFVEAEGSARKALELRQKYLGHDHPETLGNTQFLAAIYNRLGRWDKAEKLLLHVLESVKRIHGEDSQQFLDALLERGENLRAQGRFEEAHELLVDLLKRIEARPSYEGWEGMNVMRILARVYIGLERYEESLEFGKKSFELRKQHLEEHHPRLLADMSIEADSLRGLYRYEEAEELYRRIIEVGKQKLPEDSPDMLTYKNNLAVCLNKQDNKQDKLEEAEEIFRQLIDSWTRAFSPEYPEALTASNNLAQILVGTGREEEGAEMLRQVVEVCERTKGKQHPDTLVPTYNLGLALFGIGENEEAERLQRWVLDVRDTPSMRNSPTRLHMIRELAVNIKKLGRTAEAIDLLRDVYQGRKETLGVNHFITERTLDELEQWEAELSANP